MPGRDGTGPRRIGPMTGGGMGYCIMPAETTSNKPLGRRFFRRGCGQGWGNRNWAVGSPGWMQLNQQQTEEESLDTLKVYAANIKQELVATQERIEALKKTQ
ncbi:DUF5320 domain-containing protein [Candidatus Omnitrophota bacterium]